MDWNIEGKRVLITGGSSGLGLATATELIGRGADVTITARSTGRGLPAVAAIEAATGHACSLQILDLADSESVEGCARAITAERERLDVLINNAGAIFGRRHESADGWELTLATNHLGPFLLTHRLLPLLEDAGSARIINVASSGHGYAKEGFDFDDPHLERRYRMMAAYGQSKLANILHAGELDRRHGDQGIQAYSLHPGLVSTHIGRGGDAWLADLAWRVTRRRQITPEEGADTIVWLATEADPEPRGGYFEKRTEARSTRHARDSDQAERLWHFSMEALGLEDGT